MLSPLQRYSTVLPDTCLFCRYQQAAKAAEVTNSPLQMWGQPMPACPVRPHTKKDNLFFFLGKFLPKAGHTAGITDFAIKINGIQTGPNPGLPKQLGAAVGSSWRGRRCWDSSTGPELQQSLSLPSLMPGGHHISEPDSHFPSSPGIRASSRSSAWQAFSFGAPS